MENIAGYSSNTTTILNSPLEVSIADKTTLTEKERELRFQLASNLFMYFDHNNLLKRNESTSDLAAKAVSYSNTFYNIAYKAGLCPMDGHYVNDIKTD